MLAEGLGGEEAAQCTATARRKEHFGEFGADDGSFHAWLEEAAREGCLIDICRIDASNTTICAVGGAETIWAVADALRSWDRRVRSVRWRSTVVL